MTNSIHALAALIAKREDEKPKELLHSIGVGLDLLDEFGNNEKEAAGLQLIRNALNGGGQPEQVVSNIKATLTALGTLTAPTKRSGGTGGGAKKSGIDPRLPSVGSVLTREFKGTLYKVEVLAAGRIKTQHDGQEFDSISGAAQHITGKATNGYDFFHINGARPAAKPEAATADAESNGSAMPAASSEPEPETSGAGKHGGKGKK